MARAVRKVSRVSTKNQKKEGINKKLIAIISAIGVVVLGVAIGLIVYFTSRPDEVYVSEKIYFVEETYGTKEEAGTVTFEKENYYNIVRKIEDEKINEHVFIFAYDGSAFYADEEYLNQFEGAEYEAQKKTYDQYCELIKRVADLQIAVNQAASEGVDVVLYVIDVNVDNKVNAALMTDEAGLHEDKFAPFYSAGNETSFEPAFFYLHEGVVKENIDADNKKLVSTNKMSVIMSTSIKYSINFLTTLY